MKHFRLVLGNIATVLLISCALFMNVRFRFKDQHVNAWLWSNDTVAAHEEQLRVVKESLPARGGIIGYVDVSTLDKEPRLVNYLLTQYTMAPLILDKKHKQRLSIVDFRGGGADSEALKKDSRRTVKDFGNGVLLVEDSE